MARLAVVQNRLESLGQLLEVVSAMRSLAAARMQQAAEAARRYSAIVASGLDQALVMADSADGPAPTDRHAVLIFCAEHGFVRRV